MNNSNSNGAKRRSLVLEYDPADPAVALAYFESKMGFGTDPSDSDLAALTLELVQEIEARGLP